MLSDVTQQLLAQAKPDTRRALRQLATTLIPLALILALMLQVVESSRLLALGLSPLAAALMLRVFVFAHDCGHGSFFPSRKANDWCGFWLGALSLTPYRYWQHTHNAHHATSGNLDRRGLGDVTTLTRREYEALPPSQQLGYRLARSPLLMLGMGPVLLFWIKHRLPWDLARKYRKEWQSILATNGVLLLALLWAHVSVGIWNAVRVIVPTVWLAHIGIREGIAAFHFKLWDEDAGRMIPFP